MDLAPTSSGKNFKFCTWAQDKIKGEEKRKLVLDFLLDSQISASQGEGVKSTTYYRKDEQSKDGLTASLPF